jgi:hypothetical protein
MAVQMTPMNPFAYSQASYCCPDFHAHSTIYPIASALFARTLSLALNVIPFMRIGATYWI